MGPIKRSAASLRFLDGDFDPDLITRLLGEPPTSSWRKGDAFGQKSTRRNARWSLKADECSPENLDGQIVELLSNLSGDPAVWRELAQFKPDIFVGLFLSSPNEGLTLRAETMAALGARGITLGLDIYCPDDDKPE